MRTIRKVEFDSVKHVEQMPKIKEQGVLYVCEKYGLSIHLCLCGTCGIETVMPFSKIIDGKDRGWVHTKDNQGRYTMRPSVGNQQFPCKSHYIITNNMANFV